MTLREGSTPLEQSSAFERIYFKREDRNPTGSHKDRAAAYQLAQAVSNDVAGVVISSSGNAGIATSMFAEQAQMPAFVFVHPNTDPDKLAAMCGSTTTIVLTERAINSAKHVGRQLQMPNLRPSTNDDALIGYSSLGVELARELPSEVECVVLFVTSGATALAVARVLLDERPGIEVHIVQGEGNAAVVDPEATITDASAHGAAAGRLGVRRSRRARHLRAAIEETGGQGHIVSPDEVAQGRKLLQAEGITVSDESAANMFVAAKLAASGRTVCTIISGAPSPTGTMSAVQITASDEFDALAQIQKVCL